MVIYYAFLSFFLTMSYSSLGLASGGESLAVHGAKAQSAWTDVPLERRCQVFWAFVTNAAKKNLPDWVLTNPTCELAGGSSGDSSWALDFSAQKKQRALPLRYMIKESPTQKPEVRWCVIKDKKMGCAAPWESVFSIGSLFKDEQAAKAAYAEVVAMSQGFVFLATDIDSWAGKPGGSLVLFDVSYKNWVAAWVAAQRSLPTKDGAFVAEYQLDAKSNTNGVLVVKNLPKSLQDCLGCAKSLCEGAPLTFVFSGLSLTISRELTPDEQKVNSQKSASVSWLMLEPTPFASSKGQWPMLCGEHRFNIQKL